MPLTSLLGTLVYIFAMQYIHACVYIPTAKFGKKQRLYGLHWALRVLISY